MATKRLLRDFFLFSRKDRFAVITLLILIALAWCLPYLLELKGAAPQADQGWTQLVDSLLEPGPGISGTGTGGVADVKPGDNRYNNAGPGKLFRFDPNTLGEQGWRELGLRERTIGTILKYRSKGGQFREPADLEKIFGLPASLRERLLPFVQINKSASTAKTGSGRDYHRPAAYQRSAPGGSTYPASTRLTGKAPAPVDLNHTDTTALIALPCIGSRLATRILQFRDRLGGFHSVEQLREVYGITDSAFNIIRPFLQADPADCRPIAINEVTLDELKKHPYLRFDLARTIISYRQEHGGFRELADLQKLTALPAATYVKVLPYLRL